MDPNNNTLPPAGAPTTAEQQTPQTQSQSQTVNTNSYPSFVAPEPVTPPSRTKKKKFVFIGGSILAVILLLFTSVFAGIAYGYIPVDAKLQNNVADIVMQIPFTPKTPRYVLKSSVVAHQDITKFTVDASLAASSNDSLTDLVGMGDLDVQITGPIDHTDPDNILVDVHAKITKDFDINVKAKDYKAYVKINSLPVFLSLMLQNYLGMNQDAQNKLINQWFYYDTKPMETEARKNLSDQEKKSASGETVEKLFEALNDPAVIESLLMNSEKLDNATMYHVHFAPTQQVLDTFWQKYAATNEAPAYMREEKISESIDAFVLDTWIDQSTYLIHKTAVSFNYKTYSSYSLMGDLPALPQRNQKIPISFVVKLADHGKPVNVTVPPNAKSFEEFLTEAMQSASGSAMYAQSFAQARNTKRQSDINAMLNAIRQYMADNNDTIPPVITTRAQTVGTTGANLCQYLVPEYIAALPVDPSIQEGTPITSCKTTYTTGYTIQKNAAGEITVTAPQAELNETITITR